MKRLILAGLGVLAINIVVAFAAIFSFVIFLFRDDPILASLPLILVIPAVLLQPWFAAFFFLPLGPIFAPILTTVVTMIVYGTMNNWGTLDRPKQFLAKLKTRKTLIVAGVLLLFVAAVAFARLVDFPPLRHGLPPSVHVPELQLSHSRYFCLGEFMDSEWLWQARVTESEIDVLAKELGLQPLDQSAVPEAFRNGAPYWWQPVINERTKFLSTPDFPVDGRGPDGWHGLASWNPDDQLLHMWIKSNF